MDITASLCLTIAFAILFIIKRGYFSVKVSDEVQVNEGQYR